MAAKFLASKFRKKVVFVFSIDRSKIFDFVPRVGIQMGGKCCEESFVLTNGVFKVIFPHKLLSCFYQTFFNQQIRTPGCLRKQNFIDWVNGVRNLVAKFI